MKIRNILSKKNILIAIGIIFSTFILTWAIFIFLFPVSIVGGEAYNANELNKISKQRELAYDELYTVLNDEINKMIYYLYIDPLDNKNYNPNKTEKYIISNGEYLLLDDINIYNLLYLTKEELRLLRNTIYAKYGYIFQSKDLSEHFNKFKWYKPQYDNVDGSLTEYDKHIIEMIRKIENKQIGTYIQGLLNIFYAKTIDIEKTYYQLMNKCKTNILFPLQSKRFYELGEVFPAYINIFNYNGQYYDGFALKILMDNYKNIIQKIIEIKTSDIIKYIDYYSKNTKIELVTITDFINKKYYYETMNENIFDYYINQCLITKKTIDEINISNINVSDYNILNIHVVLIDNIYYDSIAINGLQNSMKIVSPLLIKNIKTILIEGVSYQTEIYSNNIDNYVNWFYSYFTSIDKTFTNIIGFFAGEKNREEKYYTDNFNRIMSKNANFDLIIGNDIDRQNKIINNIFYEYMNFKKYFSIKNNKNAATILTSNDFIEPFINDIVSYFDHVFDALDNANKYYLQEYTINDNNIIKTAKTSVKLLSSVNFFGGILVDYLSLKTQELLNRSELKQQIFNSMIENQNNKIAIINDPINYLFDKLDIGSVVFVDNYFVGLNTYQHYGVYIGNGNVVHFAPLEGQEISMENGIIHETTLEKFLNGRALQIDKNIEKKYPEDEIIKRARSRLNQKGYNLFTNNCEHFARWCVTGENVSYQIDDLPQKLDYTILIVQEKFNTISKFIELFR